MPLTREEILGRKLGNVELELPDGSGTVVVRPLNREETIAVGRVAEDDTSDAGTAARHDLITHLGLVDPALSLEDVQAWAANDVGGVVLAVATKIAEISGMVEGAGKSGVSRPRRKR